MNKHFKLLSGLILDNLFTLQNSTFTFQFHYLVIALQQHFVPAFVKMAVYNSAHIVICVIIFTYCVARHASYVSFLELCNKYKLYLYVVWTNL